MQKVIDKFSDKLKSLLSILQASQQEEFIVGRDALHSGQEDAADFFKDFKTAQMEVFEWLRNEYRYNGAPKRVQRDVDAVSGDTWYKNYQIKECEGSDKSSFCNGAYVKHEQDKSEKHVPEISELFDKTTWSGRARDGGELKEPSHRVDNDDFAKRINDKNMKVEHLFPLSYHHELSGSNYSFLNQLNVDARLSAKQFLAKQQNAIHEIEMKHQHLPNDADDEETPSKKLAELNENQLRPASSNSNFPSAFNIDTSSNKRKRSSSGQPQHFDDQSSQKKNDLFDEVNEKLSKKEQQGFETLLRVKRSSRRDVNMNEINRMMEKESMELKKFLKSETNEAYLREKLTLAINSTIPYRKSLIADNNNEMVKFLDDNDNTNNFLNDEHANTSTSTANQEMKDGNEKDLRHKIVCNETVPVNNNHTTTTDAKIKRE